MRRRFHSLQVGLVTLGVWIFTVLRFPGIVEGDFLNDYFDDKTFGINPGPCPIKDGTCKINLVGTEFPDGIGDAEFCLFPGFACQSLSEWLNGGTAELYQMKCNQIGVGDIALDPLSSTATVERNKITVNNLFQHCTGMADLENVVLVYHGTFIFIPFTITIELTLETPFETLPSEGGLDVSFDLILSAPSPGFSTHLVNDGEVENCDLNLDLGIVLGDAGDNEVEFRHLAVRLSGITIIDANDLDQDELLNFLVQIIEALFGTTVCHVIEQAGTLENGGKGVLQLFLDELNERYDELLVPRTIDVAGTDSDIQNNPTRYGTNGAELADSLNIAKSNAMEIVSVTLNEFLGNPDISPLPINQAIELLTDPPGTVFFDLSGANLEAEIELSFADAVMSLKQVEIRGLNTITVFNILQNDFLEDGSGLDYTLTHDFALSEFQFLLKIGLTLKRGEWVTVSSCGNVLSPTFDDTCTTDEEDFTFDFGLTAEDIAFDAATLILANIDQIADIQIGQIIGRDFTDFINAMKQSLQCAAPSIYALNITDLRFSIQQLHSPFVENFSGEGLSELLESGTDLVDTLIRALLSTDLPTIMRGPVREAANDFLRENVADIEDTSLCPPFDFVPAVDPYIHFNESPAKGIFPVINDVLGNFDANSDVDVNDFIETLLQYYSENSAEFPLEPINPANVGGDWQFKDSLTPVFNLPAFEQETAHIRMETFQIEKLTSIVEFSSNFFPQLPNGLYFNFTLGEALNDNFMTVTVDFDFVGKDLKHDQASLEMKFIGLNILVPFTQLLINFDFIKLLTFGQLLHVPCLFCIVDGMSFGTERIGASELNFNLFVTSSSPQSALGGALDNLSEELDDTTPQQKVDFTRRINYFLGVGFHEGLKKAANGNFSLTPATCSDAESTIEDIFNIFFGGLIPDFTDLVETCLADVVEPAAPAVVERARLGYTTSPDELPGEFLSFQDNFFIKLLSNAFDLTSGDPAEASTIQNLIIAIANSSGNAISDMLILEDDQETVSLQLSLNQSNFLFDLLGMDPLSISNSEGFIAEVQSMKVRGINKFVNDLKLFEVESTFMTNYHVGFTAANPLTIDIVTFIQANATIDGNPQGPPIQEFIDISLELLDVQIDFDVLFALRMDTFLKLSIGNFLDVNPDQSFHFTDFAANCLLANVYPGGAFVRNFNVDIQNIDGPTVDARDNAIISDGFEEVLHQITVMLADFYLEAVPNICQNCIKKFLNDQLDIMIAESSVPGACPAQVFPTRLPGDDEIFRFSDSGTLLSLQEVLESQFFSNDYSLWNTVMEALTEETLFDTEHLDIGPIDMVYKGESYGKLEIIMEALKILHLGTFTYVDLLKPRTVISDPDLDPYVLKTVFNFSSNVEDQITSFDMLLNITGDHLFQMAPVVINRVNLILEVSTISLGLELFVKFNITKFLNLRFDTIDSFDEIPCLMVPVTAMEVLDFNLTTEGIKIIFTCAGRCDAPLLQELTNGGTFTSEKDGDLSKAFNALVLFITDYLEGSPAQNLIDIAISTSAETCANLIQGVKDFLKPSSADVDVFQTMLSIFLGGTGLSLIAIGYLYPIHLRRKKRRLEKFASLAKKFPEDAEKKLLTEEMKSLSQSPVIPLFMKGFIPLFCIMNIVGLCYSILASGALTVILTFEVLSMEINTIRLVPFTVVSTINNMWNSGAWPLAVLIGVASCAWPVVKNLILLILFYIPTTLMSTRKRNKYLEFLDILGKWSFLDVFVVVITLAALKTEISLAQQPDLTFVDPDFFVTDANVQPERGIVLLCTIAATSLIINHIMAYYHHHTMNHNRKLYDEIAGNPKTPPKLALLKRSVAGYKFKNRAVSSRATLMLVVLNVVTSLFVFVGLFVPIIHFEINGLVGLLIDQFDKAQADKQYSILTLGIIISEAPDESPREKFVIVYFQFLYFIVSFVGPILQMFALGFMLSYKFSLANQHAFLNVTMIISFWAALDTVIVGVIATLLEIQQVTVFIVDFITGDICSNIRSVLETFINDVDGNCLDVVGKLPLTAIILFIGVIGQLICLLFIAVLANAVVEDRYYHAYVASNLRPRDGKPAKPTYLRRKILKLLTVPAVKRVPSRQVQTSRTSRVDNGTTNPIFNQTYEVAAIEEPEDDIFAQMEQRSSAKTSRIPESRVTRKPPPRFSPPGMTRQSNLTRNDDDADSIDV